MKTLLLLIAGSVFSLTLLAQKNSHDDRKRKDKSKNESSASHKNNKQLAEEQKIKDEHNHKIWEGTFGNNGEGPTPTKNQPAKVRVAFERDYPDAAIVSWSKYRGDWTTTFRSGLLMSTALYHANGERRDTRTLITKNEIPRNVLDSIFNRSRGTWLENIIKIETPGTLNEIFRIKDVIQGKPKYLYYNSNGKLVKYNY